MDRLEQQLTLHGNAAVLCTSVAEADAAAAGGKTAVFVAVEGAALLGCTLAGLAEGYRRGVRLVTLCWNKDNRLCGAAFDSGSGLTEAGQEFVRACWKTGVAVDLSHASEQTFWDVLAIAQRPVISAQIAEARDKGDLSENAEYEAAREAQGLLELNIAKLQDLVANARVIDESQIGTDKVQMLNKVKVKNLNTNQIMNFTLVGESEADFMAGKLAAKTPIGQALMGHGVGDVVEAKVPAGVIKFEILDITL
jgi:transcription elongation factor GreA